MSLNFHGRLWKSKANSLKKRTQIKLEVLNYFKWDIMGLKVTFFLFLRKVFSVFEIYHGIRGLGVDKKTSNHSCFAPRCDTIAPGRVLVNSTTLVRSDFLKPPWESVFSCSKVALNHVRYIEVLRVCGQIYDIVPKRLQTANDKAV